MEQIERLGLIKFDFLGLKTLTVIKHALGLIEKTPGRKIDIDKIPLDDPATYQLCSEGKTTGVFQLESSGMKDLLRRLKPEVFEDLIALVALYRPGLSEATWWKSLSQASTERARSSISCLASSHLERDLRRHPLSGTGHEDRPGPGQLQPCRGG